MKLKSAWATLGRRAGRRGEERSEWELNASRFRWKGNEIVEGHGNEVEALKTAMLRSTKPVLRKIRARFDRHQQVPRNDGQRDS